MKKEAHAVWSKAKGAQMKMTFKSLTPLIAHKYWACSMPCAIVSLSTWEQVVPEHCCTL